jgi:hypothetical protein
MLVGPVAGKVAVLIDDLADVHHFILLIPDCTDFSPGSPTSSTIWRYKSLCYSYPRDLVFVGNDAYPIVLH